MKILLLEDLATDARQWLAVRHQLAYEPELLQDFPTLCERLYKIQALVVPSWLPINGEFLDCAPRLLVLGRMGGGGSHVDYDACHRRHVQVVQAGDTSARATAEFLLMALLTLFRSNGQSGGAQNATGREINDAVIGLFGLPTSAQMLAPILVALGARVVGYDPALHRSAGVWARIGVQPLPLVEMLQTADAVSMQLSDASRYRGIVGERLLSEIRRGQLWASVSRPALFEPRALASSLRSGRMGALWLDGNAEDLSAPGWSLDLLPNLHVTPQLAPRTRESLLRGSWYLADRLHETLLMSARAGERSRV